MDRVYKKGDIVYLKKFEYGYLHRIPKNRRYEGFKVIRGCRTNTSLIIEIPIYIEYKDKIQMRQAYTTIYNVRKTRPNIYNIIKKINKIKNEKNE